MQLAFPDDASMLVHVAHMSVAAVLQSVQAVLSEARAYPTLHSEHCSVPVAVHVTQLVGHSE